MVYKKKYSDLRNKVLVRQLFQAVYFAIVTIAASQEGSSESSARLLSNSKKSLAQFKCLLAKYVKSRQV